MKSKPVHKPSKPVAAVKAAAPKKIAISAGVIAGNRLAGMTPQYPAIAKPKAKVITSAKPIAKANNKT
jgi:hypothetical protein